MEMSEAATEITVIQNAFGIVTDRRVIYYRSKGWFSGGSREDIPLQHVTSVRLEISRQVLGGILLLLIGLPMLGAGGVFPLLLTYAKVIENMLYWFHATPWKPEAT